MAVMDNDTGKLLTTGNSCRAISTNKHGAYCEETGSTIQVPWPPKQQKCWWPRCSSTASYQQEEQDSDLSMVSFFRLPWHKFIRIKLTDIFHHRIQTQKATKKWSIYIRANRGMYGLSQAGLLANKLLEKRLNKHGYHQRLELWSK